MQPTFAPWFGYLLLASKVDIFCFYDTARFSRQSFHQRNRFICNNNQKWLTVPVENRFQRLNETRFNHASITDLCNKLMSYYPNTNILDFYIEIISNFFCSTSNLAEANINLINQIFKTFDIECVVKQTSKLKQCDNAIDQIISVSNQLDCDTYLSPKGSEVYLKLDDIKKLNEDLTSGTEFIDLYAIVQKSEFFRNETPLSVLHYLFAFGEEKTREQFEILKEKL